MSTKVASRPAGTKGAKKSAPKAASKKAASKKAATKKGSKKSATKAKAADDPKADKNRVFYLLGDSIKPSVDVTLLPDHGGKYKGKPMQAAKKAFHAITRRCTEGEEDAEFIFSIQEFTAGSKMSRFTYKGSRVKRSEPHKIVKAGKEYFVRYDTSVKAYKPAAPAPGKGGKKGSKKKASTKKASSKTASKKKAAPVEEIEEAEEAEDTNGEETQNGEDHGDDNEEGAGEAPADEAEDGAEDGEDDNAQEDGSE